ncbi:MAG: ribonuclease HII [Candidatus Melainabacteria bacterium]|nr:ribonuclease HII [Candidatus Melainabacteria bacterium]
MAKKIPARERRRLEAMMQYERQAREWGYQLIAGIDEAGRGPLAGPVVAAACILPAGTLLEGIDDSKKLTAEERAALFKQIIALPGIDYGIGIIDAQTIDKYNILQATFQAMAGAVSKLSRQPDFILVDGNKLPKIAISGQAIVSGDSFSQSIAAASILAKVTRDELMQTYHKMWPLYGFASHKGYGTEEHRLAIQAHGPCPIHRMTFAPLASIEDKETQLELF